VGIDEGKDIQTKGIDNLFTKINRKLSQSQQGHTGIRGFQESNSSRSEKKYPQTNLIKTLNIQKKEY
jgi:hypothetical protein